MTEEEEEECEEWYTMEGRIEFEDEKKLRKALEAVMKVKDASIESLQTTPSEVLIFDLRFDTEEMVRKALPIILKLPGKVLRLEIEHEEEDC